MKKKILPLFCVLLICIIMIRTGTANAQGTIVAFDPIAITVDQPGTMFEVNVTVTNSPDITQYIISNITWNPSVLQVNTTSQVLDGGFIKSPVFLSKPPNNTEGRLPEITCASLTLQRSSGNGTLCTIWFFAKTTGVTQIGFGFNSTWLLEVDVVYYPGIDFELQNATATVVPEFPTSILMPLFLIITAAIALIATTVRSRRRQEHITIP